MKTERELTEMENDLILKWKIMQCLSREQTPQQNRMHSTNVLLMLAQRL